MKTLTIDGDNNITVHGSKKAAKETGLPSFANADEFAEIIGTDNHRLVEIFNSLSGVKPVTKFANRKAGAERIWKAIQTLGESQQSADGKPQPETETARVEEQSESTSEPGVPAAESIAEAPADPEPAPAEPLAESGAQAADVAPEQPVVTNETIPAKKARKAKKAPTTETPAEGAKPEATGPREGSKMAQVVAML
jgi:hypothetical protein